MSALKTRRTLTDDERAERRAAERELVKASVEQLRSSQGWQAWLAARSRFHRYSLGNQLLIAMQDPTAVRVAGFRKWLELGYAVRKGETALRIFAPCPPSKREIEEARERGEDPRRVFFKLTAVFGDDQVEPLPAPAVPVPLTPPIAEVDGESLAPVWPALVALGRQIGSTVELGITAPAHGFYEPATRRIVISDADSRNQQIKTLVHELAHALVRAERQPDEISLEYAQEELVVESVAFTVCGALGLDTSGYSLPYLAAWSEQTDLDVIERCARMIDRIANRIEDAIPEEMI